MYEGQKNRIDSRLAMNPTSGNLFVVITQLVIEKHIDEVSEFNFNITQVDLEWTSCESREYNFKVLASILIE